MNICSRLNVSLQSRKLYKKLILLESTTERNHLNSVMFAISPVCLVLLGALCLASAAPTPSRPSLVSVARYLYESLNQAQAQQNYGYGNNVNYGQGTGLNGNGNLNFGGGGNGLNISGK